MEEKQKETHHQVSSLFNYDICQRHYVTPTFIGNVGCLGITWPNKWAIQTKRVVDDFKQGEVAGCHTVHPQFHHHSLEERQTGGWTTAESTCRPDGSTGRCVFLPDRPGPWWHFCELGRWVWFYRARLFSAPHPTHRYSSGSSAQETDCLVRRPADKGKRTLVWKRLPHRSRTGTPAWCHFLRWPVLSTLQRIKGISAWL